MPSTLKPLTLNLSPEPQTEGESVRGDRATQSACNLLEEGVGPEDRGPVGSVVVSRPKLARIVPLRQAPHPLRVSAGERLFACSRRLRRGGHA